MNSVRTNSRSNPKIHSGLSGVRRVSAAVILLQLTAIVLYYLHSLAITNEDFWVIWTRQVSILLSMSVVLFVVAVFLKKQSAQTVVLALQLLIFSIAVYGEASFTLPLLSWGTALLVEAHLFFLRRKALVFSFLVASVAILLPRADSVWDFDIGNIHLVDRLAAAIYYAVVVFLVSAYNRLLYKSRSDEQSKELLQESLVQLMNANVGFQDYAVSAGRKATEEERHRITREIHDTIGYTLTNVIMMTKAAEELINNDHDLLRELLGEAREQCQESLSETRRTLRSLWAMKEPEIDFTKQVWKTVRAFEIATGIDVQLEFQNLPKIWSKVKSDILLRTLQEGLTNSFRHGRANRVTVMFWYDGSGISITIQDNGIGNPKFKEDIGIGGMRERFESVCGRVDAQSLRGGGFEIRAWLPTKESQTAEE